jgi:hypothetical protein
MRRADEVVYGQYQRPAIDAYDEVEPWFERQVFVCVLQNLEATSALDYLLVLRLTIEAGDESIEHAEHCGGGLQGWLLRTTDARSGKMRTRRSG